MSNNIKEKFYNYANKYRNLSYSLQNSLHKKYKKNYSPLDKFKLWYKPLTLINSHKPISGASNCLLDTINDNEYFKSSYTESDIIGKTIYTIGDIHSDLEVLIYILRFNICVIKPSNNNPELEKQLINPIFKQMNPSDHNYDHLVGYELSEEASNKYIVMTGDLIDGKRSTEKHSYWDFNFSELKIHLFINQLNRLLVQKNIGSRLFKIIGNHDLYAMFGPHNINLMNGDNLTVKTLECANGNKLNIDNNKFVTDVSQNNKFDGLNRIKINPEQQTYLSSPKSCLPILLDNSKLVLKLGKYVFAHGGLTTYDNMNFTFGWFQLINEIIFYSLLYGNKNKVLDALYDKRVYILSESINVNKNMIDSVNNMIEYLYLDSQVTSPNLQQKIIVRILDDLISHCSIKPKNKNSVLELRPPEFLDTLCSDSEYYSLQNISHVLNNRQDNKIIENTFIVGHTPIQTIDNLYKLSKIGYNNSKQYYDQFLNQPTIKYGEKDYKYNPSIGSHCTNNKHKIYYIDCEMSRGFRLYSRNIYFEIKKSINEHKDIDINKININNVHYLLYDLYNKLPQTLVLTNNDEYVIIPVIDHVLQYIDYQISNNKRDNESCNLTIDLYRQVIMNIIIKYFDNNYNFDISNLTENQIKLLIEQLTTDFDIFLCKQMIQFIYKNNKEERIKYINMF